jgi:predicted enzyme related to lactoylglutathione lyase
MCESRLWSFSTMWHQHFSPCPLTSLTSPRSNTCWSVHRALLAPTSSGEHQASAVGNQVAGRVSFFLSVDDFDTAYQRMASAGVEFITEPRTESYGRVAVFLDIAGNRLDLLGSS